MPLDAAVMSYLERGSSFKFKRIDAEVLDAIVDPSKENTILDEHGKTEGTKIASFFKQSLDQETVTVEAKSIDHPETPGFIVLQEDERRLRDYLAKLSKDAPRNEMAKKTFIVNTNNSLVTSLFALKDKQPELAKMMVRELFDLAALSQKEMNAEELKAFLSRHMRLLEKVTDLANKNSA